MNTRSTTDATAANQQPRKVCASFGIRAGKLKPIEITERLAIQPSHSYARGDTYESHLSKSRLGARSRPFGVWQISSAGIVKSDDLQDHVDYLVKVLSQKRIEIQELLADPDLYLDIRLWVESHDAVNALTLRAESLAVLASLCRDFNISVIGGAGGRETT